MIRYIVSYPLLIKQRLLDGKILSLITLDLNQLLELFDLQPNGKTLPELRSLAHQFTTELANKPHWIVDPEGNKLQITGVYNICSEYSIQSVTTAPLMLTATFTVHVPLRGTME
jgi:hypothetical protein